MACSFKAVLWAALYRYPSKPNAVIRAGAGAKASEAAVIIIQDLSEDGEHPVQSGEIQSGRTGGRIAPDRLSDDSRQAQAQVSLNQAHTLAEPIATKQQLVNIN